MMFKNKRWNFVFIVVIVLLLSLTSFTSGLTIQSIAPSSISPCNAVLFFDTDLTANATLYYSSSIENPSTYTKVENTTVNFFHYLHANGLSPQTTYYYYVDADAIGYDTNGNQMPIHVRDNNNGQMYTFTTPSGSGCVPITPPQIEIPEDTADDNDSQNNGTIVLENLFLKLTNSTSSQNKSQYNFTVLGMSPDTQLSVFVNRHKGFTDPVSINIENNQMPIVYASQYPSFTGSLILSSGENIIEYVLRKGNQQITKVQEVFIDITPPHIEYSLDKSYSNNDTILISGYITEPGQLKLLVNNVSRFDIFLNQSSNYKTTGKEVYAFKEIINLGAPDNKVTNYNFSLEAIDVNGNKEISNPSVVTIDKEKPLLNLTNDFTAPQHSLLFFVTGKTEPNTKISALNLGDKTEAYRSAIEAFDSGKILTLNDLLSVQVEGGDITAEGKFSIADLIGGFSNTYDAISDGSGYISKRCLQSVITGDDNCLVMTLETGVNNLLFYVEDEAGNVNIEYRQVDFEAGDPNWRIKQPITIIPNNIYLPEIVGNKIEASVYVEFEWAGPTGEAPTGENGARVEASLDGGPDNGHNKYISRPFQQTSYYDFRADPPVLYSLIDFNIVVDDDKDAFIADLDDEALSGVLAKKTPLSEFEKYLTPHFQFSIGYKQSGLQIQTPKKQFVDPTFMVILPEDLSKFLNPELINKSINIIDKMINVTTFGQGLADNMTLISGVSCGAAVLLYPLISQANPDTAEQMVYYTCDRILCPTVPAGCNPQVFDSKGQPLPFDSNEEKNNALVGSGQYMKFSTDDKGGYQEYQVLIKGQELAGGETFRTYANQCEPDTNVILIRTGSSSTTTDPSSLGINIQGIGTQTNILDNVICVKSKGDVSGGISYDDITTETCWEEKQDRPKCLFQATAPKNKILPMNDIFSSLWCECYPGASKNFEMLTKVLGAMRNCLKEAQVGNIQTATCEELFFTYICDLFTQLFEKLIGDVFSGGFATDLVSGPGSADKDAQKVGELLNDRYEDRIAEVGSGVLSMDNIVHKSCLSALTGDFSLLLNEFQTSLTESVSAAPVSLLSANSRVGGYNPTTGRLNIYYNILVSIIPGSDLTVKLELICDKSKKGGDYCPRTPLVQDISSETTGTFLASSSTLDESFSHKMKDTKYWYNVARLTLTYKVDGEDIPIVDEVNIKQKGGLLAQCSVSSSGEIVCNSIIGNSGNGNVELIKSQGTEVATRMSPGQANTNYYPLNDVMFIAQVDNNYDSDYFLGIHKTNPSGTENECKMYSMPSKNTAVYGTSSSDGTAGERQTYLLLYEGLGESTLTTLDDRYFGSCRFSDVTLDLNKETIAVYYDGISDESLSADIYYEPIIDKNNVLYNDIDITSDKNDAIVSGRIEYKQEIISSVDLVISELNGNSFVTGTDTTVKIDPNLFESTHIVTLDNTKFNGFFSGANLDPNKEYAAYLQLTTSDDTGRVTQRIVPQYFKVKRIGEGEDTTYKVQKESFEKSQMVKCSLQRPPEGESPYYACPVNNFKVGDSSITQVRLIKAELHNAKASGQLKISRYTLPKNIMSTTNLNDVSIEVKDADLMNCPIGDVSTNSYEPGSYTYSMNLYDDGNDDGTPDAPILWALNSQQAEYSINVNDVSDNCNGKPVIDIVEPLTKFVNPNEFMIGASVLDDCNDIRQFRLTIDNQYGVEQCSCTLGDFETDECETSDGCDISPDRMYSEAGYSYYRYIVRGIKENTDGGELRITYNVRDGKNQEAESKFSVTMNSEVLESEQQLAGVIVSGNSFPDPDFCEAIV